MLTLNDGRAELWQWDTGRTLSVDADCSQVHFSNKVFGRSIDVDVVGGVAVIPDILLQTDKDLNVWAFVGTAENGYTKISKTFKVNRRNKPADYVFTPIEQTTIAEIAAIAQSVRDDADAGLFKGDTGATGPKGDTGASGEAGGYYTPAVTQPDENTLRVAFTPSKEGMPAVADTDITLPAGGGGGSGTSGEDGGYYAPYVDDNGNLTWTASKTDMPAVDGANIKGPKGDTGATGAQGTAGATGATGADGKSAYAYAVEGGFTGTEAEFAAKLAEEMPTTLPNPSALTFTGAVTGSYDGSAPVSVKIPEGGSGEAWELLYETTLTEDAATFSQEIPACSKVKMVIFPGSAVSGWKRIIINGTSYPTMNNTMPADLAYFVSIDTLLPPYITTSTGIYTKPGVNGINGGFNYSSYAMIGDSITKIGCGTAGMLVTGAIIKIWGVRK